MNRAFWRPFLIAAAALALLALVAPLIPERESEVFSLKKLDPLKTLFAERDFAAPDTLAEQAKQVHIASELQPLESFLLKLEEQRENPAGNLRVAFYGDSLIEGDLLTEKLRELLQSQYGGHGVGLVPITSIVNHFRQTIRHDFSRNWETVSFMKRGTGRFPLGMIGYTFIPRTWYYEETVIETASSPEILDSLGNVVSPGTASSSRKETRRFYLDGPSWVEYSGVKAPGGASEFRRVRLFYSHASANSTVRVSYDGGEPISFALDPAEGVRVLDLSASSPLQKIRLSFDPRDPIHVYGVSFDDLSGAYVDNFAVRGFSGMGFGAIPAEALSVFHSQLDYDLVVLQYGGNVSRPDRRDYSNYIKGMEASIRHIQSALPGVPILLVGVQDRSSKQGGGYQTQPDIPILVQAQSELAARTGCAFWNLYEAMGGYNSMPDWVSAKPALAARDYTHFTRAGAAKLAEMLYKLLTTGTNG
ncbi:MAG: GDSL-type esterase/lipase family protein [Candidatus Cloacimonetes bacterium]|nr:GDSL-type esterase/lipase family protein [Candidatus Cloacimonadota bacterium]